MPLTPHAITNYDEALREQIMDGEGFEGEIIMMMVTGYFFI